MTRIEASLKVLSPAKVLAVLLAVAAVAPINYNCNTITSSGDDVDDGLVKFGDKVYICLHFLPQNVKVGFKVEVDAHVALTIRDMFPQFMNQDTDVMVQLSNSEYLSPQIVSSAAIHPHQEQTGLPRVLHSDLDQAGKGVQNLR